jgi:hypothetical protein
MSNGAIKETLPFSSDQKQIVGNLGFAAQAVAVFLGALGVVQVIGGPVAWLWSGAGFFSALLMLVQGALTVLLAMVMLAVASDFKFLGQFPQYAGNHFRNAAKNLTMFYQVQLGLTVLIGLVVLIRIFF